MRQAAQPIGDLDAMLWMADYPSRGAMRFPDRLAIVADQGTLTYAQLDRASDRFGAWLKERGIGAGARVAYLGKNSELFFPVFFACLRTGVTLVPINWRCAPGEIAFILDDSQSRLLIHDEEFRGTIDAALTQIPQQPALLPTRASDAESLQNVLRSTTAVNETAHRGAPDACAMLMYTSGTTGSSKGVMLSHRALSLSRHVEVGSPHWTDWNDDDIILSPMPNFHVGGLSWMLIGLMRSLTCILTADASPANLLRLARAHGVTRTFMVPTVVRMLLEQIGPQAPAPRLKTVYYGASTMDATLLARCIETFGCAFGQYFGMTENCGTVTFLPPCDHDVNRPHLLRSVGKPLPGMLVDIRDSHGQSQPAGAPGEIWIQSPTLMSGYWHRPDATAEALIDGWYRTGDGGYLDDQGYLFLTDRIKDMIISGGENVYPAEVEQVLRQHPAVRDVAVVGAPDATWGEIVVAVVEWHTGQQTSLAELRAFAAQRIAGYKLPKALEDMAALPRTATGKIQRIEVRKQIRAKRAGASEPAGANAGGNP
ncbi:long-chain-fatty-acid--CoA ligase [Paraburkholderia unamae]|nr:long-chain-fatty-acid--CoA ligase [Paraburkholderia unamae]